MCETRLHNDGWISWNTLRMFIKNHICLKPVTAHCAGLCEQDSTTQEWSDFIQLFRNVDEDVYLR